MIQTATKGQAELLCKRPFIFNESRPLSVRDMRARRNFVGGFIL
ncbi:Uncharacterised protein [Vibrio cholerae]|nr:Uncharacterised protein [Vibrio cholerae]